MQFSTVLLVAVLATCMLGSLHAYADSNEHSLANLLDNQENDVTEESLLDLEAANKARRDSYQSNVGTVYTHLNEIIRKLLLHKKSWSVKYQGELSRIAKEVAEHVKKERSTRHAKNKADAALAVAKSVFHRKNNAWIVANAKLKQKVKDSAKERGHLKALFVKGNALKAGEIAMIVKIRCMLSLFNKDNKYVCGKDDRKDIGVFIPKKAVVKAKKAAVMKPKKAVVKPKKELSTLTFQTRPWDLRPVPKGEFGMQDLFSIGDEKYRKMSGKQKKDFVKHANVAGFTRLSNKKYGGRNKNLIYRFAAKICVESSGMWKFRLGSDFGSGGAAYLPSNRQVIPYYKQNLWWNHKWDSSHVRAMTTRSFKLHPGCHSLVYLGVEECCDGSQTLQFSKDGGSWTDMTLKSLNAAR